VESLFDTAWEEIWVILPDYRHLRRNERSDPRWSVLLDLPRRGGCTIRYICSSPVDTDYLDDDLLQDAGAYDTNRVILDDHIVAAAQMSIIVANPNTRRPSIYVPTERGWVRVAWEDPANEVRRLQLLFPDLLPEQKTSAIGGRKG